MGRRGSESYENASILHEMTRSRDSDLSWTEKKLKKTLLDFFWQMDLEFNVAGRKFCVLEITLTISWML